MGIVVFLNTEDCKGESSYMQVNTVTYCCNAVKIKPLL
jgi:hypothetical protein